MGSSQRMPRVIRATMAAQIRIRSAQLRARRRRLRRMYCSWVIRGFTVFLLVGSMVRCSSFGRICSALRRTDTVYIIHPFAFCVNAGSVK